MNIQAVFLVLRLAVLVLLVWLTALHVRSVRVFRWEQSVSGGMLVTYLVSAIGLALSAGLQLYEARTLQAYLCATGTILMVVNAAGIYRRWRRAGSMTRMVAELLGAVGVPLRRQVFVKVFLSAAAATIFFFDFILAMTMVAK